MQDELATDILEATSRARCDHGYTDRAIRGVAEEADGSSTAIPDQYDGREQLFAASLDSPYDRHTERLGTVTGDTPGDGTYAALEAKAQVADDRTGEGTR